MVESFAEKEMGTLLEQGALEPAMHLYAKGNSQHSKLNRQRCASFSWEVILTLCSAL